jgi:hypothetical protein
MMDELKRETFLLFSNIHFKFRFGYFTFTSFGGFLGRRINQNDCRTHRVKFVFENREVRIKDKEPLTDQSLPENPNLSRLVSNDSK